MAITETDGAITQLTATGDSDAISLVGKVAGVFSIRHRNESATITVGAIVQPEISHDGTNWDKDGPPYSFSTSATTTEFRTYVPPTDGLAIKNVRFAYTAPTGGSSHTLDCRYTLTSI
jgi:hypothetical protein